MSVKLNKIELIEKFIDMVERRIELRDVMSPLHRGKNEKDKSLKRMSDKFQIFQTDIFE